MNSVYMPFPPDWVGYESKVLQMGQASWCDYLHWFPWRCVCARTHACVCVCVCVLHSQSHLGTFSYVTHLTLTAHVEEAALSSFKRQ